jgi:hypothetical protein
MRFSINYLSLSLVAVACTDTHKSPGNASHSCTAAGCESQVSIVVHDLPEQATHYQMRLTYGAAPDEVSFQCSFDLPGSSPDADDDGGAPNRYHDPNPGLRGCDQISGKKTR